MGSTIRIGKISAIDYSAGMVRVVYHEKDDSVTRWIPYYGGDEYKMPEIDDQVLVVHLSNGSEAGVVLGRPWSAKNVPPEGAKGLYRKDFARTPGEAMMRYFDGTLMLRATKMVIDGNLEVTGDLIVNGTITSKGDIIAAGVSLDNHTHTDSVGGITTAPTKEE